MRTDRSTQISLPHRGIRIERFPVPEPSSSTLDLEVIPAWFATHFEDLVIRGTDWISLAPHFSVVGVGFIIVIESVGVCAPHISIFTKQLKIKPIKRKSAPCCPKIHGAVFHQALKAWGLTR